jgi:hypothetical protein
MLGHPKPDFNQLLGQIDFALIDENSQIVEETSLKSIVVTDRTDESNCDDISDFELDELDASLIEEELLFNPADAVASVVEAEELRRQSIEDERRKVTFSEIVQERRISRNTNSPHLEETFQVSIEMLSFTDTEIDDKSDSAEQIILSGNTDENVGLTSIIENADQEVNDEGEVGHDEATIDLESKQPCYKEEFQEPHLDVEEEVGVDLSYDVPDNDNSVLVVDEPATNEDSSLLNSNILMLENLLSKCIPF